MINKLLPHFLPLDAMLCTRWLHCNPPVSTLHGQIKLLDNQKENFPMYLSVWLKTKWGFFVWKIAQMFSPFLIFTSTFFFFPFHCFSFPTLCCLPCTMYYYSSTLILFWVSSLTAVEKKGLNRADTQSPPLPQARLGPSGKLYLILFRSNSSPRSHIHNQYNV